MVRKKTPLSIRDLALMGLFSAILLGVQLAFAFLPNIELVSLLIILYTRHLKYRALPVIYVFVLLEGLIFGFGIWWIIYLYIWAILFALTMLAQKNQSLIGWAMISGGFGLFLGRLGRFCIFFKRPAGGVRLVCSGIRLILPMAPVIFWFAWLYLSRWTTFWTGWNVSGQDN